jgi:epsilon-lactone hydrolase
MERPDLAGVWKVLLGAEGGAAPVDVEAMREGHAALWDSLGAADEASRARCVMARGGEAPLWRVDPLSGQACGAVVIFHGGGWALGSARGESAMLCAIADLTGRAVFSVDYRLVPDAFFPVQVEDAASGIVEVAAAFDDLLVGGCSAGGHLALAGLLSVRESNPAAFRRVTGLRLMSPGTDLRPAAPAWASALETDWVKPDPVRASVAAFLHGADPTSPLASPLLADLRGFPAVRIQTCAEECLAVDNRIFAKALGDAGVDVELEEVRGVPHGFQLLCLSLEESRAAVSRLFSGDQRHRD